jgi:hypothetical protein
MKRRIAILALALIASPLAMMTTPAQAADVCAGTGVLNTPALQYIVIGAPNSGPISGSLGVCVVGGAANVSGSVSGGCGQSSGSVTVNGNTSGFVTALSIVVILPGQAVGVANAIPALGQSCLPPASATQFQVTGAVVLTA